MSAVQAEVEKSSLSFLQLVVLVEVAAVSVVQADLERNSFSFLQLAALLGAAAVSVVQADAGCDVLGDFLRCCCCRFVAMTRFVRFVFIVESSK